MNDLKQLFLTLLHDEFRPRIFRICTGRGVDRVGRHGDDEDSRYHYWECPHRHWQQIHQRDLTQPVSLGFAEH